MRKFLAVALPLALLMSTQALAQTGAGGTYATIFTTNQNAISYKEIFELIKDNKIWLGYSHPVDFAMPTGVDIAVEELGGQDQPDGTQGARTFAAGEYIFTASMS